MIETREIYWNVGQGVALPVYVLSLAAAGWLVRGFAKRLPLYRLGKPLDRFDRFDERVRRMIGEVLGQENVARVPAGGVPHSFFFRGMLILLVGTVLTLFQADLLTPFTGVNLLAGTFYRAFSLVLDVAGLVAVVMLGGLFRRRFVLKPAGLETGDQDYVIHLLLFAILITGFLVEGARMAATELLQTPELARFSPVGYVTAHFFAGLDDPSIRSTHKVFWWLHFSLVLGFICAIPYTKLRHMVTTSLNAFFAPLEPKGTLRTLDLEDDAAGQFGAATIGDLTWKDIFDADACTGCVRCQDRCPAHITEKPLSPMKLIRQIGELAEAGGSHNLVEAVGRDALWACTTCGACQDICPAGNEHVNKILEMRRSLTLMEGAFSGSEVRTAMGNLEVNANPFGLPFAGRGEWAEGLPVASLEKGEECDVLYFVGCFASYDRRNRDIARSFVRICAAAGMRVGILGKKERCCGEPTRKLGNEYLYQMLAAENVQSIESAGVKKVVTTCPHCFNTLNRDYRDMGLELPVEHYTTFLQGMLKAGRLKLEPEPFVATYHDSCYLGRYMDIIDQPRAIIAAAGGRIQEMTHSGYDSFCCGGGGGRILSEEKIGTKIVERRMGMARETGAPLLISTCPFCLTMFEDAIKTGSHEGTLVVKDLAEMVAARLR